VVELTDWAALKVLISRLEIPGEQWLCRGAVRCELLGELQAWDDFDVIVEVSDTVLALAVEDSGIESSRTFHGGYALWLPSGRKVDVWSISATRGQRCSSLSEALSIFEFNVDAIARSIQTGEIVDPLAMRNEILSRALRIQNVQDATDNAYMPWKAAYLTIRHRLVPDNSVARLWQRTPSVAGLPDTAISNLRKELQRLGIFELIKELHETAQLYPGLSQYVNALASE
jgi:hypothetical protein